MTKEFDEWAEKFIAAYMAYKGFQGLHEETERLFKFHDIINSDLTGEEQLSAIRTLEEEFDEVP